MVSGDPGTLIPGIIVFIVGAVFFAFGLHSISRKRLIQDTPTSKINGMAMGFVEIIGEAVASKVLKSPLTNKDCVCYSYHIDEYKKQGKTHSWVTVRHSEQTTNFYLRDDTGSVLINPERAKIDMREKYSVESGMGKDPPANVMNFLRSSGISFEGFLGINKKMRYVEYYIAPGEKLFIMGTAQDNTNVADGTAKKSSDDIIIEKAKGFFYISDKEEKDVIKTFKWKIAGGLIAGGIISFIGLFLISSYFGVI